LSTVRNGRVAGPNPTRPEALLAYRHLRIGWWSIAVFSAAGLVLETLHAFKVGAYLDGANETRRLMWTLAHAHGTLIGVLHLGFVATIRAVDGHIAGWRRSSAALTAATVLLPGGFALGGVRFYAGDPGLGVALVPVGAVLLMYAAVVTARFAGGSHSS
jgi:hypothetical protein